MFTQPRADVSAHLIIHFTIQESQSDWRHAATKEDQAQNGVAMMAEMENVVARERQPSSHIGGEDTQSHKYTIVSLAR